MAQDATLPNAAVPVDTDTEMETETSAEPATASVPRHPRGRRRKTSLLSMVHAELSAMLFMLALGLWLALILLSAFFPFSTAVDDMGLAGIVITTLAVLVVIMFIPAVVRFWAEGDRAGSVIAGVLALAMIGNWLSWSYHFNLPREVMQFFS